MSLETIEEFLFTECIKKNTHKSLKREVTAGMRDD